MIDSRSVSSPTPTSRIFPDLEAQFSATISLRDCSTARKRGLRRSPIKRSGEPSAHPRLNIPSDQFAMVHKNELVMPAAQAGALGDMLSGGGADGGGGGRPVNINPTVHFGVNAIDGASTAQFFRDNGRNLMKAAEEAVRHGAHLGMRRLA